MPADEHCERSLVLGRDKSREQSGIGFGIGMMSPHGLAKTLQDAVKRPGGHEFRSLADLASGYYCHEEGWRVGQFLRITNLL